MTSLGYKHSKEAKKKISQARLLRKKKLGFLNSPSARVKMRKAHLGKRVSRLTREKMSLAKKGKRPLNFAMALAAAHAAPKPSGPDSVLWKGDKVGYGALHDWVRKTLGAAHYCSRCHTRSARRYEWSNISLKYRRHPSDWKQLCVSCHRKEGYRRGEYTPWNKGRKTGMIPRTAFPKGHIPWNKRRSEIKET